MLNAKILFLLSLKQRLSWSFCDFNLLIKEGFSGFQAWFVAEEQRCSAELWWCLQDLMCFPGEGRHLAEGCPWVAVCSWQWHKLGHGAGLRGCRWAAPRAAPRALLSPRPAQQGGLSMGSTGEVGAFPSRLNWVPCPGSCHPPWDLLFILSSDPAPNPRRSSYTCSKRFFQSCFCTKCCLHLPVIAIIELQFGNCYIS